MKKRSSRIFLLLGVVALIIVIAALFIISQGKSTPIQPSPPSSSEESVDTNISLSPPTTPAPLESEPAPYAGCRLDFMFIITGGNLDASGNMQYKLVSKNTGDSACIAPSISVYYANDESYSSSNPAATADGYYWSFPDLAPGAEHDITLVTARTAPLTAGAVVDEGCLSANNGSDSCNDASSAVSQPATTATLTSFSLPANQELGVWVWTPVDQMSSTQMEQLIDEASANRFNVIYLTVDEYLDATNTSTYEQSLENFISLANQQNISVDAEAGSRDWAEAGNTENAPDIMSFVASFNKSHAQKFRGVQYDIEPYLLPQYQTDEGGILTDYVTLVENLVNQDKMDGLPLTIIVPDFYTATQQWTPEITVDGITDYTYNHIVRLLNELPESRIIVMAYRNSTSGPNGSIALAQPEIAYADNSRVKILVAQETGPVTPSYVTFNGLSRSDLFAAAATINQYFASDTSYGGVAIDYLNPFLNLP